MALDAMLIFVKVVDAGSFAAAGRQLGISKSTLSRQVQHIEERLHVQLLHRSTRSLKLTEAGRAYYTQGQQILRQVEALEDNVQQLRETPQGKLTVSAPLGSVDPYFHAMGIAFMKRYPTISLRLLITNRCVDLFEEGVDVALRACSTLGDSADCYVRKLLPISRTFCASPDYLAARGEPETFQALGDHDMLLGEEQTQGGKLTLEGCPPIKVSCRIVVNSNILLRQSALAGLGIALLPTFAVAEDILEGRLISVLDSHFEPRGWLYAIYPERRMQSAKVRAFVDFIAAQLNESQPPHFAGLPVHPPQ